MVGIALILAWLLVSANDQRTLAETGRTLAEKSAEKAESTLVACLNGDPIRESEGSTIFCQTATTRTGLINQ